MLEMWPRGVGVGESTLKNLLNALGFNPAIVHKEGAILGKIENYSVVLNVLTMAERVIISIRFLFLDQKQRRRDLE